MTDSYMKLPVDQVETIVDYVISMEGDANTITCIKQVRRLLDVGLMEAKEMVEYVKAQRAGQHKTFAQVCGRLLHSAWDDDIDF